MRVAIVCPYDLGVPGGVQDQVVGLAHALERRGHEPFVFAPGEPRVGVAGCSAGRSLRFRVNGSIAAMAPHPSALARTVRSLRDVMPDVVHLHEPFAPSVTLAALVASGGPVVATFHAAGERTPYRWAGPWVRRLASRIDVRVAVSSAAASLAARHLGGTYEIIGNGIDTDRYREHGRPRSRCVAFLGRHEARKGLDTLLAATRLLPADVEVRIAGEGPDTERGRAATAGDPRVRWLGRVDDDAKLALLHDAGVLCAPALHGESFGMVILEAMAAGTPVVASDIAGYRELTAGGRAAVLVPPGDPIALAAALVRVLDDPLGGAAWRAAGLARAAAHMIDDVADRYVDLYRRAVGAPRISG